MCSVFSKRVIRCGTLVAILALSTICRAQQQVIPVWPGAAPGSESWTQKEETTTLPPMAAGGPLIRNVTQPTLTAFLPNPSIANGTAVIVCPGGGFHFLSWESEGTEVAKWLSAHGIAAFVLKYRLVDTGPTAEDFRKAVMALFSPASSGARSAGGNGLPESMRKVAPLAIADGRQAMKLVRQRASQWGIAPDRIGIMGFSAGGIVTMGVVMEHDADSRPDFAGPIYGAGLAEGAAAPPEATPLFILCASDDPLAAAGSVATYTKWKAAGHPVELHMYSQGGHGFGMNKQGLPTDHWIERFGDWLEAQGFMKPKH
jgi:acetyl esterase/lipase